MQDSRFCKSVRRLVVPDLWYTVSVSWPGVVSKEIWSTVYYHIQNIIHINRRGPRTFPCGIPDLTGKSMVPKMSKHECGQNENDWTGTTETNTIHNQWYRQIAIACTRLWVWNGVKGLSKIQAEAFVFMSHGDPNICVSDLSIGGKSGAISQKFKLLRIPERVS